MTSNSSTSTLPPQEPQLPIAKLDQSEVMSNESESTSSMNSTTSSSPAVEDVVEEDYTNMRRRSCLRKGGSHHPRNRVSFSTIQIHQHEVTLGDNPSVSQGPPVSIGWKALQHFDIDLDQYEEHRAEPRRKGEMLLPRMEREDRLREVGFSRGELKEASVEAMSVRLNRLKSSRDGALKRRVSRWMTFKKTELDSKVKSTATV